MTIFGFAATSMLALAANLATAQAPAPVPQSASAPAANDPAGQGAVDPQGQEAVRSSDQSAAAAPSGAAVPGVGTGPGANAADDRGDIIVTATRRASRLSDVPVAVSAITPMQLQNTGATDIRQLTQIAPSLLVSSTSSEAGAAGARIRGIGTVGDNPGLESSVPVFIDGVYRNRPGVALTELGSVEQIEVLRGPQGTLFGRNASAGLISITTARPDLRKFTGFVDGTYGNYDFYRFAGGVSGPIGDTGFAYRLDGAYNHRDGFIKDVVSDRRFNDRDRYLVRGKLLFQPDDDISILAIGDYSRQNEQCCVAVYLPSADRRRNADGTVTTLPAVFKGVVESLTSTVPGAGRGMVLDDSYDRRVAITPGRNYTSRVRDWGGSLQVDWTLGDIGKLTSITAYRYNKYTSGYDADFNNLDILAFPDDGGRFTRFKTFTQEVRLQGSSFDDKLDWLVGGYYANEKLVFTNTLRYGADFDQYSRAYSRVQVNQVAPGIGDLFANFGGYQGLGTFSRTLATLLGGAPAGAEVGNAVRNLPSFSGTGANDRFSQTDNNYALFTHNIVHVTDTLSVTLGARHTWDNKSLRADLNSESPCGVYSNNIAALQNLVANGATPGTRSAATLLRNSLLLSLIPVPCVINGVNGDYSGRRREREWSGTAILTYKPTDRILTYGSYSRGYKAGGFNLDRAQLISFATARNRDTTNLDVLQFRPEKVDAFEVGVKWRGRGIDINVSGFYEMFKTFQLNAFDGTRFFVTDVRGCKNDLGTTDEDRVAGNSQCDDFKSGVVSKGVEIEAYAYPVRDVALNAGFTLADTRYRKNLASSPNEAGNNSLDPSLSLIPGGRVSNSSLYVVTGSTQYTPPIGRLRGLFYADFRYTSDLNTGSDLFPEKNQNGVITVNARIGIGTNDGGLRLEGWVRNAFDVNYKQIAFNTPLQGNPTVGSVGQASAGQTAQNLYSAYLAEPRTYGLTLRSTF